MACFLLWSSALRVHDSQAYRKMDVTRERISRILELREILLSFQTDFNLVNAAVACAILESISGLEPSSVITEARQQTKGAGLKSDLLLAFKGESLSSRFSTEGSLISPSAVPHCD